MRGMRTSGTLRGRTLRRLLWMAGVIGMVGAGALGATRFWAYTQDYPRSRFQPESLAPGPPRHYYLDWRGSLARGPALESALAADGVFRGGRDLETAGGYRHDPLRVIQASLALHDQLLEGRDPAREAILRRQIEWLVGAGVEGGERPGLVWPHAYDFPRYGLVAPWVSALTQGQAISLLVRAASYFDEPRYAQFAGRAAEALMSERQTFTRRDARGIFFEEFPCDPPAHALNGCLFAWLGLWDWARYTGDSGLGVRCQEILAEISGRVPDYESGGWTRYDLLQRRPTSPAYHEMHAALAEALAAHGGGAAWADRAARWRGRARSPWARALVGWQVFWAKAAGLWQPDAPRPQGWGWS